MEAFLLISWIVLIVVAYKAVIVVLDKTGRL